MVQCRYLLVAIIASLAACTGSVDGGGGGGGDGGTPDGDGDGGIDPGVPLTERITVVEVSVPNGVANGDSNWRIWGQGSLGVSPVFTVPLANCETLVGYTGQDGVARALRLDAGGNLAATHELAAARELRGLAAEPDGHFGALLWDDAGDAIFVRRFDVAGDSLWTTELVNDGSGLLENYPDDFGIGDSRFEFGDGRYGASYHVHTPFDGGHEGETLKYVTTAGVEETAVAWGCSHSMSAVLRYSAGAAKFMPACVTDCYPGSGGGGITGGIYVSSSVKIMDVAGACNGRVAAELGSAASTSSGWLMSFNTHQTPANPSSEYNAASLNQDIGLVAVGSDFSPGEVSWLTTTADIDEADSTIASWRPDGDQSEQYLVGWSEPGTTRRHRIARVSAAAAVLEGPVEITDIASWGRRDDPMRTHLDGDVVWAWFDDAGSTTLGFARVDSGRTPSCASF